MSQTTNNNCLNDTCVQYWLTFLINMHNMNYFRQWQAITVLTDKILTFVHICPVEHSSSR